MPIKNQKRLKRSRQTSSTTTTTENLGITTKYHHEFLIDEGSGNNSSLYYLLIFFTLSLMIAALYAGIDSYQRLSINKIDSYSKCIRHKLSTIVDSVPKYCTTKDGRNFLETVEVPTSNTDPSEPVSQNNYYRLTLNDN